MYLSRLEVFGFKSFAQRVSLKFDSGLTAIVGPNGCGKTNIVDAIRWVLGEQKTSVLRSDKMENVIFNGTKTRKPLGMSEVSITIENTRNILPTEYSEVTITRRLYRNGESEYLLNKVPCRLKDITDLFTDTGMGSDAYSVIELKMIEQILSENADERRKLFEEAAGVTKYKQRRKQTFKKLETTSQDLARVQDIILEVEKKVASLERQAKKAEQARQAREELRQLEIAIAERELAQIARLTQPLAERLAKEEQEKLVLSTQIDTLDADIQAKSLALIDLEKALSAAQKDANQKTELITATEKQILSNEERQKLLLQTLSRAEAELESIRTKLSELGTRKLSLQEDLRLKELDLRNHHEAFEQSRAAFAVAEQELRAQRQLLEQKRTSIAELSKKISALTLERQSLHNRIENLDAQRTQSHTRRNDLEEKITERCSQIETLKLELEHERQVLSARQTALADAKAHRAQLQAELEHEKEHLLRLRTDRDAKHTRLTFLQSLLDSYEGLPEGVKFLDLEQNKRFGLGSLADLVSIDEEYKLALAAALGEAQSLYISPTTDDALQAISALKTAAKGKLTFTVLDRLSAPALPDFSNISNVTRLIDMVRIAPELRPVLELLIGHVIVAPDLERAVQLGNSYLHLEVVTLSGEKFSARGFIRGGSVKASEGLRIGKREEMERLLIETEALQVQIRSTEQRINDLQRAISDITLSELEQEIRRSEQRLLELEKRLSQADFERTSFEKEIVELTERVALLDSEKEQLARALASLQPELDTMESHLQALNLELNEHLRVIELSEQHVQTQNAALQEKNLQLKEFEFAVEKLRAAVHSVENEQNASMRQQQKLLTETQQSQDEIFRLRSELDTMNDNLHRLYTERDVLQNRCHTLEGEVSTLKGELAQSESKLRDLSRQREVLSQLILEFQQQLSQHSLRAEHIRTVIKTEFDVELTQKEFAETDDFQMHAAQERATQLKQKLRSLGLVNELALQEYEEEKKRLDFLVSQRDDLLKAERQLHDTIAEINKTAAELFNTTFQAIRQNFINIFRELFNEGDEADLILEDAPDPLEANIEIIAKPKGKRPQAITLLSGGEKTLTATALLFAIYLVKPSPFCILDEVDAPLDDANIDRFVKLLQKFATDTQFIIVTHNKRTMEAARTLYGVTMEEEGVSKLVAVRFNDTQTT
ncbi:MAG: chromosome segregation protein SMC [[Chlorobium] sp. 445]|nr:MAG: chromosome segregation protein SMC [[Chlorobium] sp. 445]